MRIVIKVGTSTLAYSTGNMNIHRIERLCTVLSDIKNRGNEIILVSSGAIGMGMGKLSIKKGENHDMSVKQAAAAVGQCELMYTYDKYFSEYRHTVGQILLTKSDFRHEDRYYNFKSTLNSLLKMDCLPVINENDTVATEEISVGDNDTLAAMVASSADADMLIILTDIAGLYTCDPRTNKDAKLIPFVDNLDDEIMSYGGDAGSALGTGGMHTKLQAAKICTENGIDMIVMSGDDPDKLYDVMDGKAIGTKFKGKKK